MNQTVKFARIRAGYDPDRSPESTGTYFGTNLPALGRQPLSFYFEDRPAVRPRVKVTRGATVAPGTHPNHLNANYVARELKEERRAAWERELQGIAGSGLTMSVRLANPTRSTL